MLTNKHKTQRHITFRCGDDLCERMDRQAEKMCISRADIIRLTLNEHIPVLDVGQK